MYILPNGESISEEDIQSLADERGVSFYEVINEVKIKELPDSEVSTKKLVTESRDFRETEEQATANVSKVDYNFNKVVPKNKLNQEAAREFEATKSALSGGVDYFFNFKKAAYKGLDMASDYLFGEDQTVDSFSGNEIGVFDDEEEEAFQVQTKHKKIAEESLNKKYGKNTNELEDFQLEELNESAKDSYRKELADKTWEKNVEESIEDMDWTAFSKGDVQEEKAKEIKLALDSFEEETSNRSKKIEFHNAQISSIRKQLSGLKEKEYSSEGEFNQAKVEYEKLRKNGENHINSIKSLSMQEDTISDDQEELKKYLDMMDRNYQWPTVFAGNLSKAAIDFGLSIEETAWRFSPSELIIQADKTNNLPEFLKPLVGTANFNKLLRSIKIKDIEEVSKQIENGIEKPQEYSKINGDLENFGEWASHLIATQTPNTIVMLTSGGAALPILGASSTGAKFRSMQQEVDSGLENYSPMQMYSAAVLTGTAEALSERVTMGQLGRMKGLLRDNKAFKNGFKGYLKKNLLTSEGLKKTAIDPIEEGGTEVLSTMAENLVDRHVLGKNVSIFDNVEESFISGAFMSGIVYKTPGFGKAALSGFKSKEADGQLGINAEEIQKLEKILNDDTISDSSRKSFTSKHAQLIEDSNIILGKEISRIDEMSSADKRSLIDLHKQGEDLVNDYTSLLKEKSSNNKEKIDIVKQRHSDVMNGRQDIIDKYISKEQNVFTKSAKEDLNLNITEIKSEDDFNKKYPDAIGSDGFQQGDNIVINKQVAARTRKVTVKSHEILHAALGNAIKSGKLTTDVTKQILDSLDPKDRKKIDQALDVKDNDGNFVYKNVDGSLKQADEALAQLSDLILTDKVSIKENVLDKMRNFIRPILRGMGWTKIDFESSKDVLNFVKDYAKSVRKGRLSEAIKQDIGNTLVSSSVSRSVSDKQQEINDLVGPKDESGNYTITKKEWDSGKSDEVLAAIFPKLQGLIKSKIPSNKNSLPDFSEEDFVMGAIETLIPHIRNYDPENKGKLGKNTGLSGWINSQLNNKIALAFNKRESTKEKFEDDISQRTDIAIEDEVSEEVVKDKPMFRKQLGIRSGDKIYDKILNSTIKDINENILNYYDGKAKSIKPELWKDLEAKFKKELRVDIKNMMGTSDKYRVFLNQFRDEILSKLPIRELVSLERKNKEKIFTELVKEGLTVKETRASVDSGFLKSKSETQGSNLYKKIQTSKKQFLDFFLPPAEIFSDKKNQMVRSGLLGTRKDSLAEAIGSALAFDAYTKAMNSEELSPFASDVLTDNAIAQIGKEIERDTSIKNFSISSPTGDINIINELTEAEFDQIKKSYSEKSDMFNKAKALADRIAYPDKDGKYDNLTSDQIIDESEFDDAVKDIVRILENNNLIQPDTRFGGPIAELIVSKLIKQSDPKGSRIEVLNDDNKGGGLAIYNPNEPDIQIKYKRANGEITKISIEVKKNKNAPFGSKTAFYENKEFKTDEKNTNFNLQKADLTVNFKDAIEQFFDFVDNNEKGLIKRTTKGKIKIKRETWNNYKKAVSKKEFLSVSLNKESSLIDVVDHYNKKENYFLEILDSGLYFLGGHDVGHKNIFNAPNLLDQKITVSTKTSLRIDAVKEDNKKSKDSEFVTFRLRSELYLNDNPNSRRKYVDENGYNVTKKQLEARYKDSKGIKHKNNLELQQFIVDTGGKYLDRKTLEKSDVSITDAKKLNNKNKQFENSKSKSVSLSEDFNNIIEQNKNIDAETVYSDSLAKNIGATIGKYKFFVPPSAEDFMGLMYSFLGKGKKGNAQKDFIEKALNAPYKRGVATIESEKQRIEDSYKAVRKRFPEIVKLLGKKIPGSKYTYDQAIRVHLWKTGPFDDKIWKDVGLSPAEVNMLNKAVTDNTRMQQFAREVGKSTGLPEGFIEPSDYWLVDTIASDLNRVVEKVGRKKYLSEFIENKKIIFSKENLNKIEAIYGSNFREALVDILERMETGTNRSTGSNRLVNRYTKWLNNSVGAIMFLNMRSATLQTISAVNFINWSDNNILMAGKAFANQKQFWTDFSTIFNSDKLKQRRKGLKTDVNQAELASSVADSKNKLKAALNYLLKIGFAPTQLADSFAIAVGGSSMYRNRTNTYIKQGLSKADAESKAFEDFSAIAEESQQSSDPSLVSQQQSGPLGRFILAFQNTPMQYNRLIKKAALDLANKRGDWKSNISKIVYYGAVQNLIFATLQSALFAMAFDDDDDKEEKINKKEIRIMNGMLDTILRGSGVAGAAVATLKNASYKYYLEQKEDNSFKRDYTGVILELINYSPPIGKKIRNVFSAINTNEYEKDVIAKKGFAIDSPIYKVFGSLASAGLNIPLDRVVNKAHNVAAMLDSNNSMIQRVLLGLGWNEWDLNLKNEENELIKINAKDARRKEGYKKAANTRKKNNSKRTIQKRTTQKRTIQKRTIN